MTNSFQHAQDEIAEVAGHLHMRPGYQLSQKQKLELRSKYPGATSVDLDNWNGKGNRFSTNDDIHHASFQYLRQIAPDQAFNEATWNASFPNKETRHSAMLKQDRSNLTQDSTRSMDLYDGRGKYTGIRMTIPPENVHLSRQYTIRFRNAPDGTPIDTKVLEGHEIWDDIKSFRDKGFEWRMPGTGEIFKSTIKDQNNETLNFHPDPQNQYHETNYLGIQDKLRQPRYMGMEEESQHISGGIRRPNRLTPFGRLGGNKQAESFEEDFSSQLSQGFAWALTQKIIDQASEPYVTDNQIKRRVELEYGVFNI